MIFLAIVVVAITATISVYTNQTLAQRLTEERRLACLAAEQKIDEIRIYLQSGKSLDQAFQYYGPLPLPSGGPGARFDVPGLNAYTDTDVKDGSRPNPRAVGTVTIINDEAPNEKLYGYDFANYAALPPFGVDINNNGSRSIETGFGTNGASGYNDNVPPPFPLDINGNGSDGSASKPWESNLVTGFVMLPVVITVQWQGVDGPRRFDLFTIITPISDSESSP
jgi:hypothetical protein